MSSRMCSPSLRGVVTHNMRQRNTLDSEVCDVEMLACGNNFPWIFGMWFCEEKPFYMLKEEKEEKWLSLGTEASFFQHLLLMSHRHAISGVAPNSA
ncbi:unnamed protein product [Victoria cruziana]